MRFKVTKHNQTVLKIAINLNHYKIKRKIRDRTPTLESGALKSMFLEEMI